MELNRSNAPSRRLRSSGGRNNYYLNSVRQTDRDTNTDNHSSEEELEVINRRPKEPMISRNGGRGGNASTNVRSASVNALPEKRRWSEINPSGVGNVGKVNRLSVTPGPKIDHQSSGSSDDEVQGLLASMTTPCEFRSSPPRSLIRSGDSNSPPPKQSHQEMSSRRRHRQRPHHLIQRPFLDFEKMIQLKARAVNAWRHNGDHGGELSVYCW